MSKDEKRVKRLLLKYCAIGLEFAACVIIGLLLGDYLDRIFNTRPWLTIFLTMSGFFAGVKAILKMAKELERNNDEWDNR